MGEGELTGKRFLYCFFFEFTQSLTSFQLFLFSFRIYSALYIGESFCIFFFLFCFMQSFTKLIVISCLCAPPAVRDIVASSDLVRCEGSVVVIR